MNVALILAKEGSVGMPGKNLLEFQGKPLLVRAIEACQISDCFGRIFVSTNGSQIADYASNSGAEVIIRGDDFASNDRYVDSVNHAVKSMVIEPKTITIPQVVQPLREQGIFERVLALHGSNVDSVVTVNKFESSVDWLFGVDENSALLSRLPQIRYSNDIGRRNDLYEIDNAVVSFTYDSWCRADSITPWPYLGKRIVGIVQKRPNIHYHIDINTPDDAEWLEFISEFPRWKFRRNKNGSETR